MFLKKAFPILLYSTKFPEIKVLSRQFPEIRNLHENLHPWLTLYFNVIRLVNFIRSIQYPGTELWLSSVDLEVWSKLAKRARIKRIASKFARDFDSDWPRVNTFSHCVTLKCVLLPQILSYSDTKVLVVVVM